MKKIQKTISKFAENEKLHVLIYLATIIVLLTLTTVFYQLKIGHDLIFHLIRFQALSDALKEGIFPAYIDYDTLNGYGYASKLFYSDFILLPFAYLAHYIGLLKSYNILILFFSLLTIYISYISSFKIVKIKYVAYIFSIVYTFSYYRFYDLYNRAALGESICLTFLPLALWGLYEIIVGDSRKWYLLAISYSLMIYTHILTPVMVTFIFGILILINYKQFVKQKIRIYYLLLAALATICLTAYQLFPMMEQLADNSFYTQLKDERAVSFPVYRGEDMKYVLRGLFSGITYVVPEIAGVGIVITFMALIRLFLNKDKLTSIGDICCLLGLLCLFIVSPLYPWHIFPFSIINVIQFSWRFYALATLFLALGGSIYFYTALKNNVRRYIIGFPFLIIFITLFITNSGQVFTNNFRDLYNYDKNQLADFGIMGAEYLPADIPNSREFFRQRKNDSIRSIFDQSVVIDFKKQNRELIFSASTKGKDKLELPLVYYKGYMAELNSKKIEINQSEFGLVEIPLSESGKVRIWFGGTFLQNNSLYISLLSFLCLIIYVILQNRKNRNVKNNS